MMQPDQGPTKSSLSCVVILCSYLTSSCVVKLTSLRVAGEQDVSRRRRERDHGSMVRKGVVLVAEAPAVSSLLLSFSPPFWVHSDLHQQISWHQDPCGWQKLRLVIGLAAQSYVGLFRSNFHFLQWGLIPGKFS